jgi:hypothetical protein
MLTTLRVLLALLGLAAVGIFVSIFFTGAQATAFQAEGVFNALTGGSRFSEPWPATMDSELRFYAPFWGAYGVLLLYVAWNVRRLGRFVPWLAAVFFLGGVGRALSIASVGAPHRFFVFLMAIELGLPPVLVALWNATLRRGARRGGSEFVA